MQQFTYLDSEKYPIAILVKAANFVTADFERAYTEPLCKQGINREDLFFCSLKYDTHKKVNVSTIKAYLNDFVLPGVDSLGTKIVYCTDPHYFKVLTNTRKAEPNLGYVLPCVIKGYEHLQIVLGINYKSLIYNPINLDKLTMSLDTLASVVDGSYKPVGQDIIHYSAYPDELYKIQNHLDNLMDKPFLACDIEAFSLRHNEAGIATITFCWSQHEGIAFPCDYTPYPECLALGPMPKGHHGAFIPNPEVRKLIKAFLCSYQGTIRWHNATYDVKVIIATLWMEDLLDMKGLLTGLEFLTQRWDDTKQIAYLALNSCAGNELSLKSLAHPFAGNWANSEIKDIRKIPLGELLEYNLIDGLSTNYVYDTYYPRMVADEQEDLYLGLFMDSQKTIVQMELTGMPMDKAQIQVAKKELQKILDKEEAILNGSPIIQAFNLRVRREAMVAANAKLKVKQHPIEFFDEVEFNPNSGPQLQKLIYEDMGFAIIDLTKGKQPATGKETLDKLVNHATDPEQVVVMNALAARASAEKVLTSFIPAFERAVNKGDGVVWLHGSFNLGGTKSGRLSSSDPNLQNIPAGSVYGKLIKSCFTAPEGWIMCGADFASLEDRISALTTKDPAKLKVYLDGYDGHCLRAFKYFGDEMPDIIDTVDSINSIKKLYSQLRQDSKAPTFLLTYMGTYHGLMKNLGWAKDKSMRIEDNYHALYAASDIWVETKLDEATARGYVEGAFGLRVRTPFLAKTIKGKRPYEADAEGRTAGNALGQSYGLLNNRAANAFMKEVRNSPYKYDIKLIGLIHDAIYLVIRDNVEIVEWVNRKLMEAMAWQELPEIMHETVKLGAELSLFWPNWASELELPNEANMVQIRANVHDFITEYRENAA